VPYRLDKGYCCIDIRLHTWRAFFDQRDPSPFRERDLDDDAVAYIVNSYLEIGKKELSKLVIHVGESREQSMPPELFAESVHTFFGNEQELVRGRLRQMLRRARTALVVGLVFLTGCILLAHWIAGKSFGEPGDVVREGLVIFGWVAMWRPIDLLLYEWWPLVDNLDVYGRLAQIPVEVLYNS